jgi:hypothetical protein
LLRVVSIAMQFHVSLAGIVWIDVLHGVVRVW